MEEKSIQLLSAVLRNLVLVTSEVPNLVLFNQNEEIFSEGSLNHRSLQLLITQWEQENLPYNFEIEGKKYIQIHISPLNLMYKCKIQNTSLIGGKILSHNNKIYFFSEPESNSAIQLILTSIRNIIESIISFGVELKDVIITRSRKIIYGTIPWIEDESLLKFISLWELEKLPNSIEFQEQMFELKKKSDFVLILFSQTNAIVGVKLWSKLEHIYIFGVISSKEKFPEMIQLIQPIISQFNNSSGKKESHQVEIDSEINDPNTGIPFTARLMAYYRAQEITRSKPLLIDPFAEKLAGNLSKYLEKNVRYSQVDYTIVRSYFIEQNLLIPWIKRQNECQIVILGAGLDTRAYRIKELNLKLHTIYEVDFPAVISYKEKILHGEKSLCTLIRVPGDLSNPNWILNLKNAGYLTQIPTFWILEGLIYYIDKEIISNLLEETSQFCEKNSEIFADICIPVVSELKLGPFTKYFKWGLEIQDVIPFFFKNGWNVKGEYADHFDFGRDVGQKSQIFIFGTKNQ